VDRLAGRSGARSPLQPGRIWTGGELIIWGGQSGGSTYLADGARYNPSSNQWQALATAGQPSARTGHAAVWTGSELIVWGGRDADNTSLQSGGRFDPALDRWSPMAETGSPGPRVEHQATWTGSEMLVWGGNWPAYPTQGGRYDPHSNSWAPMSTSGAPIGRGAHSLSWTGSEAIVFGGTRGSASARNDGARYDPETDSWSTINDGGAPPARASHVAIWTGNEKIIWGGDGSNGARYDPATDSWAATSLLNAPAGRIRQSAIWTGTEMIIWGGIATSVVRNTGARYNPDLDHWEPTSLVDVPAARQWHSAVWDGSRMLIWGGQASEYLNDGAAYDPVDDSWTPLPELGAPAPRVEHSAEWTGNEMIIWGGRQSLSTRLNDGARFDPVAHSWTPMNPIDAPDGRYKHSSVWTGSELLVWAGNGGGRTGGLYDPVSDSWRATTLDNAPSARSTGHSSIWTGEELVIWSGWSTLLTQTGGRYDPASDSWQEISLVGAPAQRDGHTAVWTGEGMLVWGGHANAPGLWYPERPPAPPRVRIVAQTPSPSIAGHAVEVIVDVIDPSGAPEDGQLRVIADDGSQCLDAGPPLTDLSSARFACSLVFPAPGQRWLTAEFSNSASHPDLDSADSPREHRVFADQSFQIGGNLGGLLGQGLVLSVNQAETIEPTDDGPWQFTTTLADGDSYAVTVSSQPGNPVQTCAVANHAGQVDGDDVSNIDIICQTESFTIGGTVSGLAGTGLELVLNQVQTLPISEDGHFVFPDPLPDTSTWQVGVQVQPSGPAQTCTVSNGEGQLTGEPVIDVQVDCQTNLYSIGGLVSGLQGSGLVLQNNGGDDRAIGGNGSFSFATTLPEGSPYAVTVSSQPTQPLQTCTLDHAEGTVGTTNINNIQVSCESIEFIVTAQAGPGGSIDPSGPQYIEPGAQANFLITPEPGWGLAGVDSSCGGSLDGLVFTTDPVMADCSVQASFLPPAGIALASAANPATWNEPVEMTITVTGDSDPPADGMVTVIADSGESCFSPAADEHSGNQAIFRCSMSFATTGSRPLIAHFEDSSSHADGQSEPLDQDVRRTSLTVVTGMQPEAGQYVGQAYWVAVSVHGEDPTGIVTVSDDLNAQCQFDLADPDHGCDLVSTQAGIRTLTAHYPGDPDHFPSQGSRQYLLAGPEPVSLVFDSEPTNGLVDQPLNPSPRIHALDALGNLATSAEPFSVTISLSGGHPEASLNGNLQGTVSAGVAEFNDLSITLPGDDYRLHASDDPQELEPAESEPFRIQRDSLFADRFESGG
jgi:N-acetylneuraminic acid mutarotase